MICPKCNGTTASQRLQDGYTHQANCPECRFIWNHSEADDKLIRDLEAQLAFWPRTVRQVHDAYERVPTKGVGMDVVISYENLRIDGRQDACDEIIKQMNHVESRQRARSGKQVPHDNTT